jgi:hypothetical protein
MVSRPGVWLGIGRKTRASRSAPAGASPRASLNSTKPQPKDPDKLVHGRSKPTPQGVFGPDGQQRQRLVPNYDRKREAHTDLPMSGRSGVWPTPVS